MSRLHFTLLVLYLTAAAAYGGWRGDDVWSGWGIWCLLLPPLAWAAVQDVAGWHNPGRASVQIGLLLALLAVVAVGGQALLLAWMVAVATGRWSSEPAVRAAAGAGLLAAGMALVLVGKRFGKPAGPPAAPDGDGPSAKTG